MCGSFRIRSSRRPASRLASTWRSPSSRACVDRTWHARRHITSRTRPTGISSFIMNESRARTSKTAVIVSPAHTAILRFQDVAAPQRSGALEVLSGAHELGNLPDVTQVVKRPLVEHLIQSDLSGLAMQGCSVTRFGRKAAQVFDICFALFPELLERILWIGVPVQVQVHLRVVGLEGRARLRQESVDAHPE